MHAQTAEYSGLPDIGLDLLAPDLHLIPLRQLEDELQTIRNSPGDIISSNRVAADSTEPVKRAASYQMSRIARSTGFQFSFLYVFAMRWQNLRNT